MAMRSISVSAEAVRKAWLDPELTLLQAAARVGMSKDAMQDRAAALGLPHRRTGRREVIRPYQEPEFRTMWTLGISARVIGEYFGGSYFAMINTAQRLGLPMRGAGFQPRMTLDDYRQHRLAAMIRVSIEDAGERSK